MEGRERGLGDEGEANGGRREVSGLTQRRVWDSSWSLVRPSPG